jgi:hypothetical protein
MGLDIDGAVTVDSIGLALGKKVKNETGVDLGNVLDGETVKSKLERVAIGAALNELGVDAPANRDGLAEALRVVIRRRIADKIGAGDVRGLLDDIGSKAEVLAILGAIKRRDLPLTEGVKAAQNRDRQARFRATHRRVRA